MRLTIDVPVADMILFAAVVREGSFTAAARRLALTKQTVSDRMARLEERLGARLLERTTRRMRPTDVGAAYAERCAAIAALVDEANGEVQRRQAEPVGLLRVSAPLLYGRRFLAPMVSDYLRRWPRARVELTLADRRVNLVDEGYDVAIRVGDLDDSTLAARKLGETEVWYVASPRYLARHGTPTVKTLGAARCIGLRLSETWELEGAQAKLEPVLVVNDLEVACEAAIAGVGVARLPEMVCRDAIRARRLRRVFPRTAIQRSVWALYPSRRGLSAKVRLFIDTVAAHVDARSI